MVLSHMYLTFCKITSIMQRKTKNCQDLSGQEINHRETTSTEDKTLTRAPQFLQETSTPESKATIETSIPV